MNKQLAITGTVLVVASFFGYQPSGSWMLPSVGGSSSPTDISFAKNGLYFYLLDGQTNANAFVQRYGLLGF